MAAVVSLQGGRGSDVFLFDTPFRRGVDHIVDFGGGDDIHLEKAIFSVLPLGRLAESAFAYGASASDSYDRIIYELDSGVIRYDADGTGAVRAQIVAVVDNTALLRADDFLVV